MVRRFFIIVQRRFAAGKRCDRYQPRLLGGRTHILSKEITTAHVQNDIDTLVIRQFEYPLDEVFGRIINRGLGPQFETGPRLFCTANGRENPRSAGGSELDGRRPDPG